MQIDFKESGSLFTFASNVHMKLTGEQIEFLRKAIFIARTVQSQVLIKLQDREIPIHSPQGMFASVTASLCVHRSNWGQHPIAQPKFYREQMNAVNGNNLTLVDADIAWAKHRQVIEYSGKTYKSYRDLSDFAVDLSDTYAWKYNYEQALAATSVEQQIKIMSKRSNRPFHFQKSLLTIIADYNLRDYDLKTRQ